MIFYWIFGGLSFLLLVILAFAYVCYRLVFYKTKTKPLGPDEYEIPEGEEYETYREEIIASIKKGRETAHEAVCTKSFDGLTLCGNYYEYRAGAPLEILFHGYRGNSERDLSAGVERCFALGRNALQCINKGDIHGHSKDHCHCKRDRTSFHQFHAPQRCAQKRRLRFCNRGGPCHLRLSLQTTS